MAVTNLREYLSKLEGLLNAGHAPEVIHHCRHILQHYPKNAATYRLLGRALTVNGRFVEAGDVMRRVLGVFPDDFDAHMSLSEVYRSEKRSDDAIGHLERAYEQQPNNPVVLETLREFYRKYRKQEFGKFQLTGGAVARQYIRNGLYSQAQDTLQRALADQSDRVDLRLLLAQTYWEAGNRMDAGEQALQVLHVLPDCMKANLILGGMWLAEGRPSDAQRYIDRIQSLDPYLALELARGEDISDDTFTLNELDYQRAAEQELTNRPPDWLQDMRRSSQETAAASLAETEIVESGDWMDSFSAGAFAEEAAADEAGDSGELPSWFAEYTEQQEEEPPPTVPVKPVPGPRRGLTGLLNPQPDVVVPPTHLVEPTHPSYREEEPVDLPDEADTPAAAKLSTAEHRKVVLPDWLSEAEASLPPADEPAARTGTDDDDPLAWLRGSGIQVDTDAKRRSAAEAFVEEDQADLGITPEAETDPLAWMNSYGGKPLRTDEVVAAASVDEGSLPAEPEDDADPLAWLKDTGIAEMQQVGQQKTAPLKPVGQVSDSEDSLDWLSDESLLEEAFDLESLVNESRSAAAPAAQIDSTPEQRQDDMTPDKDPLDWLSEPEETPSGDKQPDEITWSEKPAEPPADEFPDWLSEAAPDDGAAPAGEENFDWMSELPDANAAPGQPAPSESEVPDWLQGEPEMSAESPVESQPAGDVPDWLNAPASEPAAEQQPDWLSELPAPDEIESAVEREMQGDFPDWLNASAEAPVEAAAEIPAVEEPDWLRAMSSEAAPAEAEAALEEAEWVSSAPGPTAQTEVISADEFEWMETEAVSPVDVESAAAETPDWLSALQPDQAQEFEPEFEAEAEPVAAETPDWLSALQPDQAQEFEPEFEAEAEPVAAETPDWLSEAAPMPAELEAAASLEEEPLPFDAAMPEQELDWLHDVKVDAPAPTEFDLPAAEASGEDWAAEIGTETPLSRAAVEADTLIMDDTPEWLSAMQPEAEAEAEAVEAAPAADDGGFEWMSIEDEAAQAERTTPSVGMPTPDWISELQAAEDMPEETAVEAAAETPDWLSAMQPEGEEEIEPAQAEPEWLSAMQPEAEAELEGEAAAEAEVPDWLSEAAPVPAEVEATAAPLDDWEPATSDDVIARMSGDTPDWLTELQAEEAHDTAEVDEARVDVPAASVADVPDWLHEMQPDAEAEPEAPAAALSGEQPDWLG
ncbi:MAG: tetratricopeptide repeat protein, partial [Anaerolineae bacterium]|nr:tetratricopeptide repeat protein [Anaerolineae bacterium]